jgi:hypothetical protein
MINKHERRKSQTGMIHFEFPFVNFEFVSDFEFRISNFSSPEFGA